MHFLTGDTTLSAMVTQTEADLVRALDHLRELQGSSRVQVDICRQVVKGCFVFFRINKAFMILMDLDPYSISGSGSSNSVNTDPIRIRIQNSACRHLPQLLAAPLFFFRLSFCCN